MRPRRIAAWSLGLVAVLVGAGAAILLTADFGAYKGYAETAVADATGRKLSIDGPVSLALFPAPSLVAEKVAFANAPWGSRPAMVTVGRIEARVALLPLLSGEVVVKRLVLDRPDILIETGKGGRGNWQMGASAPPSTTPLAGGGALQLAVLHDVTVEDARLTWRDGATGKAETVALDRLTIHQKGPGAPFDLTVAGKLDDRAFALAGRVANQGLSRWSIDGLKADFGTLHLAGALAVDAGGAPPRVTGKLAAPEIDLAALGGGAKGAARRTPGNGRVIPNVALPLDALHAVDAELDLAAKRIVSGKLALDDASLHLTLMHGKLAIRPFTAMLAGGPVEGAASLDGAGMLTFRLAAKNVDMARLSDALDMKGALAAKAALDARLAGRGRTLRAVAADLDGTVGVALGKGTIGSGYVNLLGADLVRTLLPGGGDSGSTALDCAAAPFTVTRGVARTDGILFDTDRMTVRGAGTVSLRDETIDLLLKPAPKDASLVSLATPIRVGGTLAQPSAYPDPAGVVKGVAGAVAGAALGPLGLLLPLVSGGTDDATPCLAAAHPRGKPTAAPNKAETGPGSVVREIGSGVENGIRGLFGR